jgi:hypothetical protein
MKGLEMKAKILPLKGKYYGTEIEVTDLPLNSPYHLPSCNFKVWHSGDYLSSDRELGSRDLTREEYNNNSLVECNNELIPAKEMLEICDSHFESQFTYELAQLIVNAINNHNETKGI